jgi:hypothetical protein
MYERLIVLLVRTPDHSLPEDLLWLQEGRKGIRTICTTSLSWRQERRKDRLK